MCICFNELVFSHFVQLMFYRSIPSTSKWKFKVEFVMLALSLLFVSFFFYVSPTPHTAS